MQETRQTLLAAPLRLVVRALANIQSYTFLSSRAIANLFSRPIYGREIVLQMDRIGVGSLTIILLTGFFTGAVLGIQSESALRRYGAVSITGQLVAMTLVRELAPVLAALMLAGRIGSGIASELGSMMVSEQVNAMRAMGTDPTRKLVTPRMIATVLMLPFLTIVCAAAGMFGGWLIARFKLLISSTQYWSDALGALEFSDVFGTLLKPVVFGFIIAMTGCWVGLQTSGGTEGVGRATTHAVVSSSILVITADFFLNNFIISVAPYINR